jgi:hypothetical protein
MIYLTDLADKEVESVQPYDEGEWGLFDKVAIVKFTDGTELSVHIDARSFYYKGEEVRQCDLDVITSDRFFSGGVIRTPEPPRFRLPKDPVLREIMVAFKELKPRLMNFHGRQSPLRTEQRFEDITRPWEEAVRRYFGYRRGNNLTSPKSVSIQTNKRRAKWSLKLSNSRAMSRLATMLPSFLSGSRRKERRA